MAVSISEFIATALTEIVEGVDQAREKSSVQIAPLIYSRVTAKSVPQYVEFELQVQISEQSSNKTEGGVGAKLLSVIGADVRAEKRSEGSELQAQKIRFTIPVYLDTKKPEGHD